LLLLIKREATSAGCKILYGFWPSCGGNQRFCTRQAPLGARKKTARRTYGNYLLIFNDFFEKLETWHAPRNKRIILPPKSNIFRSAVPGWLPGTALHFLASGAGRAEGGKASGGQRALPFGIPPSEDTPNGPRPRPIRRAPQRPKICTAQRPKHDASPIHGRVLRPTTIYFRCRAHMNTLK